MHSWEEHKGLILTSDIPTSFVLLMRTLSNGTFIQCQRTFLNQVILQRRNISVG